ncbi:FAD:protein FMN transferase [Engelhardtia mirabilis]|uniref:FAD:protein FMN transferase n=1 Tax=Engelhardtia mirabilis TaxID=2528011 RepID=A0A518BKM1_9BACT|nr:Thiamine biosynthesis lipoprotein ApbE precursor [Planctomycetes bacterium Pla133]QDV01845.1 Thiamine biosynthesis lipoprotein ApbE precursor [Planctomycetes bacterium Pla86]
MTRSTGRASTNGALPVGVRCSLLLVMALGACSPTDPQKTDAVHRVSGLSMGTSWNLVAVDAPGGVGGAGVSQDGLAAAVQQELDQVDRAMSTWKVESELSRFNRSSAGETTDLSAETASVVELALDVWDRSGGAFDPTVGPLVDVWGFGAGSRNTMAPSDEERERLLSLVGMDGLELLPAANDRHELRKLREGLQLDLSGIAKGFAVDEAAAALEALDLAGYFLEVGGEVRFGGQSPRGDRWRVGIERPMVDGREVALAVSPDSGAVATSGDYRRFRDVDGARVSHTIDPRTGRPVLDAPASVTVVGPSCARADALATALMVLGADAGLRLIEETQGYEALFLLHDGGAFTERQSSGFAGMRVELPAATH